MTERDLVQRKLELKSKAFRAANDLRTDSDALLDILIRVEGKVQMIRKKRDFENTTGIKDIKRPRIDLRLQIDKISKLLTQ